MENNVCNVKKNTYKYLYVYKIIDVRSNTIVYVGQHRTNLLDDNYMGSGLILQRAYKKNGYINYRKEIIEFCNDKKTLDKREKYWINELNLIKKGFNISEGGTGGNNRKWTDEEKKKNSEFMKNRYKSIENREKTRKASLKFYNEKRTEDWNKSFSEKVKNGIKNRCTEEYREKLRVARNNFEKKATKEFKESLKKKISISKSNTVLMYNNDKKKYIKYNDVFDYLKKGFLLSKRSSDRLNCDIYGNGLTLDIINDLSKINNEK